MTYPTKRQRLLNEIRRYHLNQITPESDFVKVDKVERVVMKINERLPRWLKAKV